MRRSPYHRHPLAPALVVTLAVAAGVLLALFMLNAMAYAYGRIGLSRGALFAVIALSLLGGAINIPIARIGGRPVPGQAEVIAFGIRYRVPVVRRPPSTILAVNVGGALVPFGVSVYLLVANPIWLPALAATAIVAAVVHLVARPVAGLGIAVPALVPPVIAATAALLLSPSEPAAVAYVAGTLGSLIGADLLNLRRVRDAGATVASIGGAGTFDGVFLSGLVAVLLVGLG